MLQLFKMLCVISSEEAVKLHDGNRSQFAKIFHVIANTADGKQKAEILQLADWDTSRTKLCANKVIDCILRTGGNDLPKKKRIIFER